MGLVERSAGTPQLPLKAPSFTSYTPKRQKYKALPPRWKVPPGCCRSFPFNLTGDNLHCPGGTFQHGCRPLNFEMFRFRAGEEGGLKRQFRFMNGSLKVTTSGISKWRLNASLKIQSSKFIIDAPNADFRLPYYCTYQERC